MHRLCIACFLVSFYRKGLFQKEFVKLKEFALTVNKRAILQDNVQTKKQLHVQRNNYVYFPFRRYRVCLLL